MFGAIPAPPWFASALPCPEAMRAATSYVVSSLSRAERSALAGRSKLKKLLALWRLRAAERATSLPVPTGCRSASPTRLSDDSKAATASPTSIAMTAFVAVVCRRGGGVCERGVLADWSGNEMPCSARPLALRCLWAVGGISVIAASELEIDERGDTFRAELIHNQHPDAEARSQHPSGQAGKLRLNIG